MKICKIQGTKIYQFHRNVHQLHKTIIQRFKEQKYEFFQTLSKLLPQLLYLAHSKQLKSLTMVENVSIGCLHTTVTLCGCHNGNFSCIP
jgi:hypothetical protein